MRRISKIIFVLVSIFLLLQLSLVRVYPGWFKHYGGSDFDEGHSIKQTSDGGYIIVGDTESYSYGGDDIAIYKLDSNGNKVWFKHYGGAQNDHGRSIQQISDGGYILAGWTYSYTYGECDFAIYKLDSNGNKIWFKHYGGTGTDQCRSIQQTTDGGYIAAGNTQSFTYGKNDFAIYKLDSNGNKVWFKHYGGTSWDTPISIQQTSDGGYIVAGYTDSYTYGDDDFAIYRLDSVGNNVWFKHYGGTQRDYGGSIQQTNDGGYIVAGHTQSFTHGNFDFAIYKLDSDGNKSWFKHYGGGGGYNDYAFSILQTSDGGYIVAGDTSAFSNGNFDFAIYRLDSNGNKIWFKHYGGTDYDCAKSIHQTSGGGYIVAGETRSFTYGYGDFGIYKLDSAGNK